MERQTISAEERTDLIKETIDRGFESLAPNLLNQTFEATKPDMVWASDITQLRTPEGWIYLAVVLDLFARCCVGWAIRCDYNVRFSNESHRCHTTPNIGTDSFRKQHAIARKNGPYTYPLG